MKRKQINLSVKEWDAVVYCLAVVASDYRQDKVYGVANRLDKVKFKLIQDLKDNFGFDFGKYK